MTIRIGNKVYIKGLPPIDVEPMTTASKPYSDNAYTRHVWNEALEAAANNLAAWYPDNVSTNAFCAAIRSMKK